MRSERISARFEVYLLTLFQFINPNQECFLPYLIFMSLVVTDVVYSILHLENG